MFRKQIGTAYRLRQPFACALACGVLWLAGCGYPEVSPDTYELAKALHTVFNQKSETDLQRARALVEQRHAGGQISAAERDYLLDMIESADGGEWSAAEEEARKLISDQVQ